MARNRLALASGVLFLILVSVALAAPVWADVAGTGPSDTHETKRITIDGERRFVVTPDGVAIGPTFSRQYFLGADSNGRDTAVRLLYGARNSLTIGVIAALLTVILALLAGLLAGYLRGWVDAAISRAMDVLWAYPVILLGVALGTALNLGGVNLGPLRLAPGSKLIPVLIIAVVYIPYMARPLRGQVLALRERTFVEAARARGAGPVRIMAGEILPNLMSSVIVFIPLMVANAILLEAALSYVGAGVQAPDPTWGTMIGDGADRIITAPHLTIVPGIMLVLTVLSLNVFGDGVRDALDPRATIRVER